MAKTGSHTSKHQYGITHFAQGILRKGKEAVYSIVDALKHEAKCGPCGCDPCLGYWTNIDVETGEVVAIFIEGGAVVSMPLAEGREYLAEKQKERL
jgi:Na+-translocating ferredoxin:NAD+ oxidoreductase RNF subunit RnfB